LIEYPTASFGFIGSRTLDKASGKVESYIKTQRFRVYKEVVEHKFGTKTFEHITYEELSGYLLLNKACGIDLVVKENAIKHMFADTYNNLPDL